MNFDRQIYKVFYNNRCVILTDNMNFITPKSGDEYYQFNEVKDFVSLIKKFEKQAMLADLYVYAPENLKEVYNALIANYEYVPAAGGIVRNEKNQILVIYRFHRWDLPKGHVEKGEEIANTAIREVIEETGVKNLEIVRALDSSFHVYNLKNEQCIKETYWFEMKCSDSELLFPQTSEAIEIAKWIDVEDINTVLIKTYPSLKDLLKTYLGMN